MKNVRTFQVLADYHQFYFMDAGAEPCWRPHSLQSLWHFAGNIEPLLQEAKSGNAEAMYQIFFHVKKSRPDRPPTQNEEEMARFWLAKAGENNNWRAA